MELYFRACRALCDVSWPLLLPLPHLHLCIPKVIGNRCCARARSSLCPRSSINRAYRPGVIIWLPAVTGSTMKPSFWRLETYLNACFRKPRHFFTVLVFASELVPLLSAIRYPRFAIVHGHQLGWLRRVNVPTVSLPVCISKLVWCHTCALTVAFLRMWCSSGMPFWMLTLHSLYSEKNIFLATTVQRGFTVRVKMVLDAIK